jgi:hypothetical protein
MTKSLPIKNYWKEQWKRLYFSIPDLSFHYEISNYGRIKSFQNKREGALIQGSSIQGYPTLNIRTPQKAINQYIHKLQKVRFKKICHQDAFLSIERREYLNYKAVKITEKTREGNDIFTDPMLLI